MSTSKQVEEAIKLSSNKKGACMRTINFVCNMAKTINACRENGHPPDEEQLEYLRKYSADVDTKYKVARGLLQDLEDL